MTRPTPPAPREWEEARAEHRRVDRTRSDFRVVGRHDVHGATKGEIVSLTHDEAFPLIAAGHIEPAADEVPALHEVEIILDGHADLEGTGQDSPDNIEQ